MWAKSHSIVTKAVTKQQMWQLYADVNNWSNWDKSVEFAQLEGKFEQGNHFLFQPKGGPKMKILIFETVEHEKFVDLTIFPLAKMYGAHLLEETAAGLKITTTMKMKGILGWLWIKLVAQKIVDDLPADMEMQIQVASQLYTQI
jgi:hypothetical protein